MFLNQLLVDSHKMLLSSFLALWLLVCIPRVECAALSSPLPASPCPSIFKYATDSVKQQIYGIVDTRQQQVDKSGTLELHLSIAGELLSKYVGSIEAIEDNAQILEQFNKGRGVTYRVNFPIQEPLPKLTKVIFNGRELCTGPGDRGSFVSSVTLRHFLRSDTCTDQCDRTPVIPPKVQPQRTLTPVTSKPVTGVAVRPQTSILPPAPSPITKPVLAGETVEAPVGAPAVQHEYQRTIERKEETNNPQDNSTSVKYIREEITYRKQVITPGGSSTLQSDELQLPSFVSGNLAA
ncbi:serine protease gd-like [Anopheles albimanus]|uniref:GD_N domain-containing protein n=1 Tax=Anopheles albimanus TaxID=7167 RepID=A0A182F7H4_ANOAL|nr:serine protease gd-like [Anopheles albimanus]